MRVGLLFALAALGVALYGIWPTLGWLSVIPFVVPSFALLFLWR